MNKTVAITAAGVLAALIGGTAIFAYLGRGDDKYAQCRTSRIASGGTPLGGAFTLTGGDGARVSSDEILTAPSLIYFGYTYCPDVCPLDSSRNADAAAILREQGIDVANVFITFDPDRDTPEAVGEFASFFDDKMIGLTGSTEELNATARKFRVYFAKNGDGDDYLMDHSSVTYLTETDGTVIEFFRREMEAEALADTVACYARAM